MSDRALHIPPILTGDVRCECGHPRDDHAGLDGRCQVYGEAETLRFFNGVVVGAGYDPACACPGFIECDDDPIDWR